MKTFRMIGFAMVAILMCLSACSSGGDDPIDPIIPDPKPEVVAPEITIDSSILANGLNFTSKKGEQSITFTTNEDWTISVAAPTSGASWCTPSVVSGSKGIATVKFSVLENVDYENRSVTVTIKASSATKTFTITQKCAEALLITTNKYELGEEGGTVEIEVKANIDYKMEIAETAKSWITESSTRALKAYKHTLKIAASEESVKREGEVRFVSGSKVESVKIYQSGEAVLLLSKNEYSVSDKGATVSIDVKGNVDFGVRMPNVDWITDEASSRGMSSHTLKYVVSPNGTYDGRSAEIVFYDKNSSLKETLKITQVQKDALIVSKKEFVVQPEGETIEVELNSNVDFDLSVADNWVTRVEGRSSRGLVSHKLYFQVVENGTEAERSTQILITDKKKQISEAIVIKQKYKEKNIPYLTFSADAAQTLTMSKAVATLQYSVKGGEWKELGTNTVEFGGDKGDLRLRGKSKTGTATEVDPNSAAYICFGNNTPVDCNGDIRTLVNYEDHEHADCSEARFIALFSGCTQLISAPSLPSEVLASYCYFYMFNTCRSLIEAPELPASTLAEGCYNSMFYNCSSLIKAPELLATTDGGNSYNSMFSGCNSLDYIKVMLITYPELELNRCASVGTIVVNRTATWVSQYDYKIPTDWTIKYEGESSWANDHTPYLTFSSESKQTLALDIKVPYGESVFDYYKTIEYSVDGSIWNDLFGKKVTFGGVTGDLKLRSKNPYGTAKIEVRTDGSTPEHYISGSNNAYILSRSTIKFGTDSEVVCTGDIRTLVDYENYEITDCSQAGFIELFNKATVLTSSPKLPIKTLATLCYESMFSSCTSLTSAPELPATTLAEACYQRMFSGCTSLASAPELSATTLADNCYTGMFDGCTSLITAPELPATNLADHCYNSMFYGCTSLTTVPELPATTLMKGCYSSMFSGCSSLVKAPALPAATLTEYCYSQMFINCQKLSYLKMMATDITAKKSLEGWKDFGGSSKGTFVKDVNARWDESEVVPKGWTVIGEGEMDNTPYITFKADEIQVLTISKTIETLEYSLRKGPWQSLVKIQQVSFGGIYGDLQLRGKSSIGTAIDVNDCATFEFLNDVDVSCTGDIRTLIDYRCYETVNTSNARFCALFMNCDNLIKAPELPIETLASECYRSMFYGCAKLQQAPELRSKTLAYNCYNTMFARCTSLRQAPVLPAETLANSCYMSMFSGCSNLTQVPVLSAKTLANYCYTSMFYECISLVNAPELPAEKLTDYCYNYMFNGCKKLKNITMLATDISAYKCLDSWVSGVASTGTFTKNKQTDIPVGSSGIPNGWDVVDKQ